MSKRKPTSALLELRDSEERQLSHPHDLFAHLSPQTIFAESVPCGRPQRVVGTAKNQPTELRFPGAVL